MEKKIIIKGCIYEGDFEMSKSNLPSGRGKIIYPRGMIYEGDIKYGKAEGKGRINLTDNYFKKYDLKTTKICKVYEGDFKDNSPNGKGKMTYSDDTVCEGDFKDGKPHGKAIETYPSGTVYEGEFKDGDGHGKAKLTCINDSKYGKLSSFEGDVSIGRFVRGKSVYQDGSIYEGHMDGSDKQGKGKLTFPNGNIEVGYFNKNILIDGIAVQVDNKGNIKKFIVDNYKFYETISIDGYIIKDLG